MPKQVDPLKKGFAPMKDKTLQNVLSHRIGTEFPRIGGPRIRQLCAQMILEVIDTHGSSSTDFADLTVEPMFGEYDYGDTPSSPATRKRRSPGVNAPRASAQVTSEPMAKHPVTFTARVPQGR